MADGILEEGSHVGVSKPVHLTRYCVFFLKTRLFRRASIGQVLSSISGFSVVCGTSSLSRGDTFCSASSVAFVIFSGSLAIFATTRKDEAFCSSSSVTFVVLSGSPADWIYP